MANPSKLRVDLRFFADLITAGLFPEKEALQLLGLPRQRNARSCERWDGTGSEGGVLSYLVTLDKKDHANLPTVLAFAKHCGIDYTGSLLPIQSNNIA